MVWFLLKICPDIFLPSIDRIKDYGMLPQKTVLCKGQQKKKAKVQPGWVCLGFLCIWHLRGGAHKDATGDAQGFALVYHKLGAAGFAVPKGQHQIGVLYNGDIAAQGGATAIAGIVGQKFHQGDTGGFGVVAGAGIHPPGAAGHNLGGGGGQVFLQMDVGNISGPDNRNAHGHTSVKI